jgi:hypothetical protein
LQPSFLANFLTNLASDSFRIHRRMFSFFSAEEVQRDEGAASRPNTSKGG